MTGLDAVTQDIIRSGVIQHFEFTYELAWKFMRRQLAADLGQSAIESINSRRDLFRVASENGLITDVDAWFRYHVARNQTSHTYDQQKAADVYTASLSFAADAAMLLAELEARNA
jgi:nucleotidyltransferase substrate binding protein (TIGR01987 family)